MTRPGDNQLSRAVRRPVLDDDDLIDQALQVIEHLDDGILFVVHGDDGNPAGRRSRRFGGLGSLDRIHPSEAAATASLLSCSTSQGTVRFMPSSKSISGTQLSSRWALLLETSLPA